MRAVVAVDADWGIGKNGQLLCHLSADLKHFKAETLGRPVILGRKTLETFPHQKPLPGRPNLILSRNPDFRVEGAEVYANPEEAVRAAGPEAAVIGGAQIYARLLPLCDEAVVTKIEGHFGADAFFPDLDADPAWAVAEESSVLEENGIRFRYVTYRRTEG